MMKITKIDAVPQHKKRTRVAAYCRVSTLHDNQITSLDAQRDHYLKYINDHAAYENWEFAGLYYEEGVSGTKKEIRPELQRMLKDCRDGKIDLILTKSISRFSRNTTECIEMVRALKNLNVNIIFEKENIDTRREDGEFILTLLSTLAEEESHSISSNLTWRYQKQFRNGTFRYKKAPYGYRLVDGTFEIDEVEAEVLKWMFERVLEGKGTAWIARELNRHNIPAPEGNTW